MISKNSVKARWSSNELAVLDVCGPREPNGMNWSPIHRDRGKRLVSGHTPESNKEEISAIQI